MTAAKAIDVIWRLPGCAGHAADAVSAYNQVKMEDAPSLLKIPKSECPDIWIRLPKHKWPKSWVQYGKIQSFLLSGLLWERQFRESSFGKLMGKKFQIVSAYSLTERKDCSCLCTWTMSKWQERNKIWIQCGRYSWKTLIWENQDHSFTMFIWVALNENAKQAKILWTIAEICLNPGYQLEEKQNWLIQKKSEANISSWSYDMERHAKKCVERYCDLAHKNDSPTTQSRNSMFSRPSIQRRRIGSVGELSTVLLTTCSEMSILGSYW